MRWIILLLPFPAVADVTVFFDTWVSEDRGRSAGVEFALGEEWRPVFKLAGHENLYGARSWYSGVGVQRSFWQDGDWRFSGSISALYFRHEWSDPVTTTNGSVTQTIQRNYSRTEYWTASPGVVVSLNRFGLGLLAYKAPDEEIATALQLSYSF